MIPKKLILLILCIAMVSVAGCVENKASDAKSDAVSEPSSAVEVVSSTRISSSESALSTDVGAGRGIVVSGSGKIRVTPDLAVFTVGVITTGDTAQEASSSNARIMSSVVASLKDAGVDEKGIQTQSVNVWPEYDYGRLEGDGRETPSIIGYRAENRVSVRVRDIEKTGTTIDAAMSAGANQLYGLSFTVSDQTSKTLRAQVLKAAVADATDKAQAIADALGVEKISPVRVVESGGYSPPIYRYDVAALETAGASTPVSPGETEVTASVTVTFDFEA